MTLAMTAAAVTGDQRKALVMGRGDPFRDSNGNQTHPQGAKNNFLKYVGNPANDPAKGWTCDMSWDLMERLGMDPNKTTPEELFAYIGQHQLGYHIVMQNGAGGANLPFWGAAVDNGIMPFAPHGNNTAHLRLDDAIGLKAAVSVGGGFSETHSTYGPGLELFDAVPDHTGFGEDAAQSWANQMLAAKFAKILDRHPDYNIWDARQHLRQAASRWDKGWTERNGFGRVNLNARVGKLLPGQPVEFQAQLARNARQVIFTWRNFVMSDFAATVIVRQDGRTIYDGAGTNFVWTTDHNGAETFTYWSRNKAGEKSRMEVFQTRTVTGLKTNGIPSLLVLGGPAGHEAEASRLASRLRQSATNWLCDVVYRPGNSNYDGIKSFPWGNLVALLPDWPAMVDYALSNHYRLVLAPGSVPDEPTPARHADLWVRAVEGGMTVVVPHSATRVRLPGGTITNLLVPPRLGAAIVVGFGIKTNLQTRGPGLEFFDSGSLAGGPGSFGGPLEASANSAAANFAAKLIRVLEANPDYNQWDARQHLRQSASYYAEGWRENGGYGRPPVEPARIEKLDLAPPLEIQAVKSDDGKSVTFSWLNFRQTDFAATVIQKADGATIYEGAGTNFTWRSEGTGEAVFKFVTRGKSGKLSREEGYTTVRVK